MPSVIDGTDNFSTDTDLVALTGADLTAVGIVGTNPYASLCKRDGSIVGGSDNGKFIKWANGELECRYTHSSHFITASAKGVLFFNNGTSIPFPLLFQDVPELSACILPGTGNVGVSLYAYNLTVVGVNIGGFGAINTDSFTPSYIAKGRWK